MGRLTCRGRSCNPPVPPVWTGLARCLQSQSDTTPPESAPISTHDGKRRRQDHKGGTMVAAVPESERAGENRNMMSKSLHQGAHHHPPPTTHHTTHCHHHHHQNDVEVIAPGLDRSAFWLGTRFQLLADRRTPPPRLETRIGHNIGSQAPPDSTRQEAERQEGEHQGKRQKPYSVPSLSAPALVALFVFMRVKEAGRQEGEHLGQ